MSAVNFVSLAPIIAAHAGKIVGIGVDPTSVDEFLNETKWPFDLLIDDKRLSYSALQLLTKGWSSCWGICICCNSVGSWYKKSQELGFSNDASGNWTQYGGTILLAGLSGETLYFHKQTEDDFESNFDAILTAIRATQEERDSFRAYPKSSSMQ